MNPQILGITGGIGSGKSVVAQCLYNMNIPIYNTDNEAKRLNNTHPAIRQALEQLIGEEIYTECGYLNKPLLVRYLFENEHHAKQINAIIHPYVEEDFLQWKQRQESPWVAIESAILYESGFDRLTDKIITIYAPQEMRIERASKRDHTSVDTIRQRMEHQMPDEEKRIRAAYTIINDDKHPILPQILDILANLLCKIPR